MKWYIVEKLVLFVYFINTKGGYVNIFLTFHTISLHPICLVLHKFIYTDMVQGRNDVNFKSIKCSRREFDPDRALILRPRQPQNENGQL